METIKQLNEIANALCENAENLRVEESSEPLSNIICISFHLSDKKDSKFRIYVDHYGDIDDFSLVSLLTQNFRSILGDIEVKQIICNGRQYEEGNSYFAKTIYI